MRIVAYLLEHRGPRICRRVLNPPWARTDAELVAWGLHLAFEYGGAVEVVNA